MREVVPFLFILRETSLMALAAQQHQKLQVLFLSRRGDVTFPTTGHAPSRAAPSHSILSATSGGGRILYLPYGDRYQLESDP